jgi:cytochrome c oxidase assembly protein subunit 15
MTEVDLYNLEPILELMAVGLAVAALPLGWWLWQQRRASPSGRLKALTLITLFLTFDLVLFGAFTRLTDSGLGCPDWPGCYGSATPIGAKAEIKAAETAMPTGPVTKSKAWIEMVHRYLATGVGVLILTLAALTWWLRRHSREVSPWLPTLTLVWVCMQGAFGALTVTMKLFPAIVTLHLMGGIGLLVLLMAQAVRYDGAGSHPLPSVLRLGLWAGFVLLCMQIALGGWVSTNYAVLACPDFPTCHGQWVPERIGKALASGVSWATHLAVSCCLLHRWCPSILCTARPPGWCWLCCCGWAGVCACSPAWPWQAVGCWACVLCSSLRA